ncbi:7,8-didemethyl-8-hydroxy-5-deazariboflavin synthase subunit CofG [Synechococcus elongatus]|uniref:7,8-didemethyl-8-hydroxy-5-deazariboflavin synthase n=1 Tax=Synechococcus elongatus PCC 11801 TaxID=2219813 RepID=A0AAN1QQN5_SYNEL|nr:7,8-didemethyl-8-hydroxy-5-deazariboflavin synthase subunit CofG [Synechococcus elongatus]AZB73755.1 7,8-didemethyl-8-hydroxy-5-deazariboflavin synthase subunit CofG [Synechococcus elongatus PCC 11801]
MKHFSDRILRSPQQSAVITYSPAYTLVPTYECFNRCTYCNFRKEPGQDKWLSLEDAKQRLLEQRDRGICEVLLLSGEVHPHSPRRAAWLQRLIDLAELALEMGFLPHTNAGPLSREEMTALQKVNVSLGLMLEQLTPRLQQTVHRLAPSKVPQLRLQQLEQAGELGIPFTTGLLLGIGETADDRIATLEAIAACHNRWGHIQEVILQPHVPGSQQAVTLPSFPVEDLIAMVAIARQILPASITIQVPPNLLNKPDYLTACLAAGARDLGGIVPRDEVNPDYEHLDLAELHLVLARQGWQLQPRLPVYPAWIACLPDHLQETVAPWLDRQNCPNVIAERRTVERSP